MADKNDALLLGGGRFVSGRDVAASADSTVARTQARRRRRSPALGVVLGVTLGAALWACLIVPVVLLLRG